MSFSVRCIVLDSNYHHCGLATSTLLPLQSERHGRWGDPLCGQTSRWEGLELSLERKKMRCYMSCKHVIKKCANLFLRYQKTFGDQ